jgi:fermentation-respiration switch protein FrsA (DUF1100 family)
MKKVTFKNEKTDIAGNLYFPDGFSEANTYPAIVCVHPGGGVKEQTSGLYAGKLAREGFITLAFDASFQGESGGEPRQLENPYVRVEDVSAAVDYLTTLHFVDNGRIGALGVCAGGGYAANAAMVDRRIRALGTVSAVNYGAMFRNGWTGTENPGQAIPYIDMGSGQRTKEANGAETGYLPIVPMSRDEAHHPDFAEAYDYYRTPRAMQYTAPSTFTIRSLGQLVTYDAFNLVEHYLTQPLLVVAGSAAGSRWMSEDLVRRSASLQKSIHMIEGATHMDLYDKPEYVTQVLGNLAPFFKANL